MELIAIGIIAFILVVFGVRGLEVIGKFIGYLVFFIVTYIVVIYPVFNVISQIGIIGFVAVILFVFTLGIMIFSFLMFIIKGFGKLLKEDQ